MSICHGTRCVKWVPRSLSSRNYDIVFLTKQKATVRNDDGFPFL